MAHFEGKLFLSDMALYCVTTTNNAKPHTVFQPGSVFVFPFKIEQNNILDWLIFAYSKATLYIEACEKLDFFFNSRLH